MASSLEGQPHFLVVYKDGRRQTLSNWPFRDGQTGSTVTKSYFIPMLPGKPPGWSDLPIALNALHGRFEMHLPKDDHNVVAIVHVHHDAQAKTLSDDIASYFRSKSPLGPEFNWLNNLEKTKGPGSAYFVVRGRKP